MRVLLVPEVYRSDATACGTLNDAVAWVEQWLARDVHLHAYWLLPPRERAGYDAEYVLADRERVTLLEAESLSMSTGDDDAVLTDCGYTREQLETLRSRIFDQNAYVDVVVDQLRGGRFALNQWLLAELDNHWGAQVRPFDVVANVHDLQVPLKYRGCAHRNGYQMRTEITNAVLADGIWFTAGVDRAGLREHAVEFLRPESVDSALEESVTVGSPIDVGAYEEQYADEPTQLHVAGSFWKKKRGEYVLSVAERLHEQFGVRTVLTSMDSIPPEYRRPSWVEAHPEASRETYERALRTGDLAVCASDYETMARTPFEQAASGQVLIARDEPWIDECTPGDHPLVGDLDELASLAAWAVEHWEEAVAANRRLVEHVRDVRGLEPCGRRTYEDLCRRVDERTRAFELQNTEQINAVRAALDAVDGAVALDELNHLTAEYTDDGGPVLSERYILTDLVFTLRSLGYRDTGRPGTPAFRPTERVTLADEAVA